MMARHGAARDVSHDAMIATFADMVREGTVGPHEGDLRLGVDLGTANIVLSVVDANDAPVAGAWQYSRVVRDGIVVDWLGAVRVVKALKENLERRLAVRFTRASVAVPPAVSAGTTKIFTNVLEATGLEVEEVVDEPVAAARVLGLRDGCVIDVGHGTTGVSILRDGQVVRSVDEATGGHHMTLVLSGAYGISYDAAEALKKDSSRQDEVFGTIRPTVEKMATIAASALEGFDVPVVYLVGGSSSFAQAPRAVAEIIGRDVIRPAEPLFVTPLGIAMSRTRTGVDA